MIQIITTLMILLQSSLYSLSFTTANGQVLSFGFFQGKKILVVNIATSSKHAGQLTQLETLQQQFKDSVVVVAFPSNSFQSEARGSEEVAAFCKITYGTTFLIAQKGDVKGAGAQPLYQWLTHKTENGRLNSAVQGDFQKYLIDEAGNVVGVFAPQVQPLSDELQKALQATY